MLDGCIVACSGKSPTERSQWGYSIHDQYGITMHTSLHVHGQLNSLFAAWPS